MSKDYKNIDELFQAYLKGSEVQAPASVKKNLDKQIGRKGRGKLWLLLIPFAGICGSIPFVMDLYNGEDEITHPVTEISSTQKNDLVSDEETSTTFVSTEQDNSSETTEINSSSPLNDDASTTSTLSNTNESKSTNSTLNSNTIENKTNKGFDSGKTNKQSDNVQKDERKNGKNVNTSDEKKDTKKNQGDKGLNALNKKDTTTGSTTAGTGTKTSTDNKQESSNKNGSTSNNGTTDSKVTDKGNSGTETNNESGTSGTDFGDGVLAGDGTQAGNGTQHNNLNQTNSNSTSNDSVDTVLNIKNDRVTVSDTETDTTDLIQTDSTDTDTTAQNPNVNLTRPSDDFKHWLISVHGGPEFKKSKLLIANTADDSAYQSGVSDRIGYSIGIDGTYRLKKLLMFGAGIEYGAYSEKFSFQKSTTVLVDSTITWNVFIYDSIPDSNGYIYLYDSTSTTTPIYGQQELYNQSGTNQQSYLRIPIKVGAQLDFGKLLIDVYAVGRFNLLLKSQITYLQNDQLVTVNSGFKNTYFDLQFGTNLHYNIWKNLYITGTFRYKVPIKSNYYPATIQNKFQTFYTGLGITINL